MHRPLDPTQLAQLPDDILERWADAYANSYNGPALAQVKAEQADRAARRAVVAAAA